jgi:hypothetical protein
MSSRLLSTFATFTRQDGLGGHFHVTSAPCVCRLLVASPYYGHMTVADQPDSRNRKLVKSGMLDPTAGRGIMEFLRDPTILLSVAELSEALGIDLETVNNWIRRGIINRARIGGRQLRHRLFSVEEVYKTALKNELVQLGIPPSSASNVVDEFWKEWDKKELPEGRRLYAVLAPREGKWTVLLCWQKISGGALYKIGRSAGEIELPKRAFAVIPISDLFETVTRKFGECLGWERKKR